MNFYLLPQATQRIQTVSTQQSMLQLLQQSNPHTTIVPPNYSNEPPPSYATSMQHAEYKETTPSHPIPQLPNVPQSQPPPY